MRNSTSSYFCCAQLSGVPCLVRFFCPFASRPWLQSDIDSIERDLAGNYIIKTPYVNNKGYVDFRKEDPEDPRNWSTTRSWLVSLAAIFLTFNGALASSITSGCLQSVSEEFDVSEVVASLGTTLFILGYCAGPLVFAPISEFYGRRWVIYPTFTAYVALNFLCAFAPNIGSLLAGRFLTGTFVSASLSATPGILADLWDHLARGKSIALFSFCAWSAPSLGTIAASFIDEARGWRWAFYFILIMGGAGLLVMTTIPETHTPTILAEKAARHRRSGIPGFENLKTEAEDRSQGLYGIYKTALSRPWVLLFDPISFCCNMYMAVIFALQFMLLSVYPIVFNEIRSWSVTNAQLPLLGIVLGAFLGGIVVVIDTRRRQDKEHELGKLLEPEEHLFIAKFGGIGFTLTIFWFAWTAPYPSIHWVCPTLAGALLSTSLLLIFVAILNYLTETYLQYAASIVAANTIARSLASGSAPLFTTFMFDTMKVWGGGSFIGGIAFLLAFIPFAFSRYGQRIRARSKYPSTSFSQLMKQSPGEEHFFRA